MQWWMSPICICAYCCSTCTCTCSICSWLYVHNWCWVVSKTIVHQVIAVEQDGCSFVDREMYHPWVLLFKAEIYQVMYLSLKRQSVYAVSEFVMIHWADLSSPVRDRTWPFDPHMFTIDLTPNPSPYCVHFRSHFLICNPALYWTFQLLEVKRYPWIVCGFLCCTQHEWSFN